MPSKRYYTADDAYGQLQSSINASQTTITLSSYQNIEINSILTLVQYGTGGVVVKKEKVYVSGKSSNVLTVTRGYDGSSPQSFNANDYIFLNVTSEVIKDVHLRIDEIDAAHLARIVEIESNGDQRLKVYRVSTDPALQVRIGAGVFRVGATEGLYAGGTLTVTNGTTTYVMIDGTGVIRTSTSAWNSLYARLGVVVSSGGAITSITLWKNDVVGGEISIVGFTDTRTTPTIPNDYNDSTLKAQIKELSSIGLNGIASGTLARLVGFRGINSSSGGMAHETAYTDDGIYSRRGSTTSWGAWSLLGTPTGTISQYSGSGSVLPAGYLLCDGSAVSRTTYSILFTLIGTTYGTGDGSTTFNLPNLKGRIPVGYDVSQTEFNALGKTGGEKNHTLTIDEMPAHTHPTLSGNGGGGGSGVNVAVNGGLYNVSMTESGLVGSRGSDQAHNNLQPYITVNYIIKT